MFLMCDSKVMVLVVVVQFCLTKQIKGLEITANDNRHNHSVSHAFSEKKEGKNRKNNHKKISTKRITTINHNTWWLAIFCGQSLFFSSHID